MEFDCVVCGGLVTHHDYEAVEDIGIQNGIITCLGDLSGASAKKRIEAKRRRILPGGIDPHTHLDFPYAGLRGGDSVHTGTLAAAYGGTTCILDFSSGSGSPRERIKRRRDHFEQESAVIDFGLHCVCPANAPESGAWLEELSTEGVTSIKYYMNNQNPESDGILLDLMEHCARNDYLICLHAENECLTRYYENKLTAAGKTEWKYFPESRPDLCELEAIQRVALLAEATGAHTYIMHVSTAAATAYLAERRSKGLFVYGETCPHYLSLTKEMYTKEDGDLYSVMPPLRKEQDRRELWRALRQGSLQCVSSDHVSYTTEEKRRGLRQSDGRWEQDFTKLPGGLPGIEIRLPTLVNGVLQGDLSWTKLVCVNSYYPSLLFGLSHRKGEIACGLDADLVILQDQTLHVTGAESLHMNCDYTPYTGMKYQCLPHYVLLRGEPVIAQGHWTGLCTGKFISRKTVGQIP